MERGRIIKIDKGGWGASDVCQVGGGLKEWRSKAVGSGMAWVVWSQPCYIKTLLFHW